MWVCEPSSVHRSHLFFFVRPKAWGESTFFACSRAIKRECKGTKTTTSSKRHKWRNMKYVQSRVKWDKPLVRQRSLNQSVHGLRPLASIKNDALKYGKSGAFSTGLDPSGKKGSEKIRDLRFRPQHTEFKAEMRCWMRLPLYWMKCLMSHTSRGTRIMFSAWPDLALLVHTLHNCECLCCGASKGLRGSLFKKWRNNTPIRWRSTQNKQRKEKPRIVKDSVSAASQSV